MQLNQSDNRPLLQPDDGEKTKSSGNNLIPSTPCVVPWPFPKELIPVAHFVPLRGKAARDALFEEEGDPPW